VVACPSPRVRGKRHAVVFHRCNQILRPIDEVNPGKPKEREYGNKNIEDHLDENR